MLIDYETLRVIWWLLLGGLLIGFAIMDGFDLGVAMLLPWVAREDLDRRILINSIAPIWEGNQVWLILAVGAIFAAWPALYAVAFSSFYLVMLVILLALILRPVGFKYRSKLTNELWRKIWDICVFIGGFFPALIFGIIVGNVIQGIPFYFDESLRSFYTGSFFGLLNPFAIACGVVSVLMMTMHGAVYLSNKTEGILQRRSIFAARITGLLFIVLFILAGVWVAKSMLGYVLISPLAHDGPSNPLYKNVSTQLGAWLNNYRDYPWTISAPLICIFGAILAMLSVKKLPKIAFIFSASSLLGVITTVGVSMFPFILPSSSNPNVSLMVWDSSSSQVTLFVMLIAVIIFMPIVLVYTAFVYRVLRGKINTNFINDNDDIAY